MFRNERVPVMITLWTSLKHRKEMLHNSIEKCVEAFQSQIQTTQIDAFSSIRTSIIGELLEASYRMANREHGQSLDQLHAFVLTYIRHRQ